MWSDTNQSPLTPCIVQDLSPMQKNFYRWILTRDVDALAKNTSGRGHTYTPTRALRALAECAHLQD
jgi:hypothetical protein